MLGALGGILGGGNLLSMALNIVSMVFPQAQMLSSLMNMVTQGVGQAAKGAIDQLSQQGQMPKFLADAAKKTIDDIIGKLTGQNKTDSQCDAAMQDKFGGDMKSLVDELTKMILDNAKALMDQDKGDGKSSKKSGGSGKGEGAGGKGGCGQGGGAEGGGGTGDAPSSWLEAIAKAMGEAAGNKAAKMVELSNKLKELSSAGGSEQDQQKAAKEMNAVNAQFQAVAQEFNMLQSAFSTAIKSLGEGLAQMARKQ
jgi:hypothetical protein